MGILIIVRNIIDKPQHMWCNIRKMIKLFLRQGADVVERFNKFEPLASTARLNFDGLVLSPGFGVARRLWFL